MLWSRPVLERKPKNHKVPQPHSTAGPPMSSTAGRHRSKRAPTAAAASRAKRDTGDRYVSGGLYRPLPSERTNYDPHAEQRTWEVVREFVQGCASRVGATAPLTVGAWNEVDRADNEFIRIPLLGVTTLRTGALLHHLRRHIGSGIEHEEVKNTTDTDVRHYILVPRSRRAFSPESDGGRSRSVSAEPSHSRSRSVSVAPPQRPRQPQRHTVSWVDEVAGVFYHLSLVVALIVTVRFFYLKLWVGSHNWLDIVDLSFIPGWSSIWRLVRHTPWWLLSKALGVVSALFAGLANLAAATDGVEATEAAATKEPQ